jgi:hypothetical protein
MERDLEFWSVFAAGLLVGIGVGGSVWFAAAGAAVLCLWIGWCSMKDWIR